MRDSRRLVVGATLRALDRITIGDGRTDPKVSNLRLIARDHRGDPYIPGTSLAGVLRQRMLGLVGPEATARLFGADADVQKELLDTSPLVIDDASLLGVGEVVESAESTVGRVGRTVIDRDRAAAGEGLLFEDEFVCRDTEFQMRLHLVDPTEETKGLLGLLLRSLDHEPLAVGASTRSGRGRLGCSGVSLRELDLTQADQLRRYLLASPVERDEVGEVADLDAFASPSPVRTDARLRLRCTFRLMQPLLAGAQTVSDADGRQNISRHAGLDGTSIRGALRSRAERIQRTMLPQVDTWDAALERATSGEEPERADVVSRLFGSVAAAGRVRFFDARIRAATKASLTSNAIDRWTAATLDRVLFVNEAIADGTLKLDIEVAAGDLEELGLFFLAFFDLAVGDLPVGSRTRRGMGEVELIELSVDAKGSVGSDTPPVDSGGSADWSTMADWSHPEPGVRRLRRAELLDELPAALQTLAKNSVEAFVRLQEASPCPA